MTEKRSWNWIEEASDRIKASYPLAVSILCTVLYFIYLYLHSKVEMASCGLDLYIHIIILDTFVLIAYLIIGVKYFTSKMRTTFWCLETYPDSNSTIEDLYNRLESKFTRSKIYYLIVALIAISFVLIPIPTREDFWYYYEPSMWSALLDIFNYIAALFILYLMATILWIMISVSWLLGEIGSVSYRHNIKIDLFSSDNVGGLTPIRRLILELVVYQFIAISLGIMNFITPGGAFYIEITFFLLLFVLSISIFIKAWHTIDNLLDYKRKSEVESINQLYNQLHQRVRDMIITKNSDYDEERLNKVLTSMDWFRDERIQVLSASRKTYTIKNIITFISTSFLPIATLIVTYIIPLIISKESAEYATLNQSLEILNEVSKQILVIL